MFRIDFKGARGSLFRLAILAAVALTVCSSFATVMGQGRQLSLADVLIALRSKKAEIDEKNRLLADAVKQRGITFSLTPEIEKELDNTGARTDLMAAIRQKAIPPSAVAVVKTAEPEKVAVVPPKPVPPPQDFAYFRNRAAASAMKSSYEDALTDLSKALELKPADPETTLLRAEIYLKVGKPEAARADFDKVISIDNKSAAAYFGRAQLLEKDGKMESALSDYDKAAQLDPKNEQAKTAATRLRDASAEAVKKAEAAKPSVVEQSPNAVVSVGPLNPYAINLAQPVYSALDRRMNFFGKVTVQISLDENGKVTSAQSIEGPRSLRASSEEAIKRSKFRPVKVGQTQVKATGFIVFNFVNQ